MDGLTIGEVAAQAKVHSETLRYYERRGLVARPPRSASNYRRYPQDSVRRVRFIKRAQQLGFSLTQILRKNRGGPNYQNCPQTGILPEV